MTVKQDTNEVTSPEPALIPSMQPSTAAPVTEAINDLNFGGSNDYNLEGLIGKWELTRGDTSSSFIKIISASQEVRSLDDNSSSYDFNMTIQICCCFTKKYAETSETKRTGENTFSSKGKDGRTTGTTIAVSDNRIESTQPEGKTVTYLLSNRTMCMEFESSDGSFQMTLEFVKIG